MNVGFLADKIPYQNRRGWGVYSYQLLKAILSIDKENTYRCFYNLFRKGDPKFILDVPGSRLTNRVWPIPGRLLQWLWEDWGLLAAEDFLGSVDIFHSPYEFLPKTRKARTVVTVHDVSFLKHPDYFDPSFVELFTRRIRHIVKKADKIIADSHNTKKELAEFTGVSPDRVVVIHLGMDEQFRPIKDREKLNEVAQRYKISGPYILFIGAADKDKNLTRLTQAFAQLIPTHDQLQLVFAGSMNWGFRQLKEQFASLSQENKIVFTGFIDDSDLPALYCGATTLAIPSIHEGFGLPALEAMACGTPVLCSNTSSFPEVVGDAALQVDPYNLDEIAASLRNLVEDNQLRLSCIEKGLARAEKFSWDNTARQTIEVYKELA